MELRTLKYFLAVLAEGNISNAAKALHVTQPTLSRQLAALEDEFGRQLYVRTHKGVIPTEEGIILQRYAEQIVALSDKAEEDMKLPGESVAGPVHIGAGETEGFEIIARAMDRVRAKHPGVWFEIYSGTTAELKENLIRGFYDVLVECDLQEHAKLNVLRLPADNYWGVVVKHGDPLAKLSSVTAEQLSAVPVITSRQGTKIGDVARWLGPYAEGMNVVATYNLPLNGLFTLRGSAEARAMFCYQGLAETGSSSDLVFVPLEPRVSAPQGVLWRKTLPNKQTQAFLDELSVVCSEWEGDLSPS